MSPSVPAAGALTSKVTLSVSNSTSGSSALTGSPGFLNQRPTVASLTDSPRVGTRISVAIVILPKGPKPVVIRPLLSRERLIEERLQLRLMLGHQACGRRGRCRAASVQRPAHCGARVRQHPFQIRLDEGPGAHVLRLLLTPDHVGRLEPGEFVHQRLD